MNGANVGVITPRANVCSCTCFPGGGGCKCLCFQTNEIGIGNNRVILPPRDND